MNKQKKKNSTFKFYWPKWEKGHGINGFKVHNKSKSSRLVNGLTFTCILLSLSSGLVDITCYSGVSVSTFHVAVIPIAASLLYTAISIGLISGKFFAAENIGMLNELRTQLETNNFTWAKSVNKNIIPWHIAHKGLILISLLTSLSMSVNSVGTGIRKQQQNIANMSADAEQLIELNNSVKSGVNSKREAAKSTITGNITAKDDAKQEVDRYYDRLVSYQGEYLALSDEDKAGEKGQAIITKIVNEIPGASRRNAIYFTKADLQKSIQSTATKNETVDDSSIYEEAVAYDKGQIEEQLKAIADKEYRTPDGELIQFTDAEGNVVNVQLAISRLQTGISAWQLDNGDVGESSKVFTMMATYIKSDEKAGGMGTAEKLLMGFIFFTGILQEFLIYLCTPAAAIDRDILARVKGLHFKDKNEMEDFLLKVYDIYHEKGILNDDQYDYKCAKCYRILAEDRDSHRQRLIDEGILKLPGSTNIRHSPTNKKKEDEIVIAYNDPVSQPSKALSQPSKKNMTIAEAEETFGSSEIDELIKKVDEELAK